MLEILFGHAQFVNLEAVHAVCHIDTTIRTFLHEVSRLFYIGIVVHLGSGTTRVAEALNQAVADIAIHVGVCAILIQYD